MTAEPNLFPLKLLVIFLGIALAGGLVFVLCTITSGVRADMNASCPDATLHLGNQGTVMNVTPQGKNVQVTLAAGATTKVLTADRCTGQVLQTLTVAP